MTIVCGVIVAPFDWDMKFPPRYPVPVDAIPDIGENQQVVFTDWAGQSPQDIEDQVSFPITTAMLGIPGVKAVRSISMFGFSTVYVIFKDNIDFFWARSRILERLNSMPPDSLPAGVKPRLGPDATALGQVFWYTLEGRDAQGKPTGGWDLQELRSIQDWYVRYSLLAADGISEVASIGGHVKEYQIDVDPVKLQQYDVSLRNIADAVRKANKSVGARTIEINNVEYVLRGLGYIKNVDELENTIVKVVDHVPVYLKNLAVISLGPALRRGALDKGGAEAVGAVAVVRYGYNPLAAIKNLKRKITEISPGLPEKVVVSYDKVSKRQVEKFAESHGFEAYSKNGILNQKNWLKFAQDKGNNMPVWLALSKVHIVPFYDRTELIHETLETLNKALIEEILLTVIVIMVMLGNFRSSLIISSTLPIAVLCCFIAMKVFGVDANIVALSGIAIAIGTIVDMGIIMCENIVRRLQENSTGKSVFMVVYDSAREVASAILTAILTTVVSFLPVFTMIGAEGKLFRPLAFTKTFALLASVIVSIMLVPVLANMVYGVKFKSRNSKRILLLLLAICGVFIIKFFSIIAGVVILVIALYLLIEKNLKDEIRKYAGVLGNWLAVAVIGIILVRHWQPLGPGQGFWPNLIAVTVPIALLLLFFWGFQRCYAVLLRCVLRNKVWFLTIPFVVVILGVVIWLGVPKIFNWCPPSVKNNSIFQAAGRIFPGMKKEFMPALDEGSFLYMPTTMPHASLGEVMDIMRKMDLRFAEIPEVETAVGKLGRADTALDPAPVSMIETIITCRPEFFHKDGKIELFKYDPEKVDFVRNFTGKKLLYRGKPYKVQGAFVRDKAGLLIPDSSGMPFRQWRPALVPDLNPGRQAWQGIRNMDDIWQELVSAAKIPGVTAAPKLQPIAARLVMLQSGIRAPMAVKIKGQNLKQIEQTGLAIEKILKKVPGIDTASVFADRIIGKPYLEINIRRDAIARYGLQIQDVQDVISVAAGGKQLTMTVEGRERYPVRVRYLRELRNRIEDLKKILVPAPDGSQIPLNQIADIYYVRGPQSIKTEDTFLVGYVMFDKKEKYAEVEVVEAAERALNAAKKSGTLIVPSGVNYSFTGNYENQVRATRTLSLILPIALLVIFLLLHFEFKSVSLTFMVFSAIAVAWSGAFIFVWLYSQEWFMNITIVGYNLRQVMNMHNVNLSVAVWVGFLALFGIATDDGVVIMACMRQHFRREKPDSVEKVHETVVAAASRRIRPCLMTSATTILALLPVLTATGRGSDIMGPMAIPSFGGMLVVLISSFVIPVLYSWRAERQLKKMSSSPQERPERNLTRKT
jgi:Cu(I)/Ag(I) efflux system membrane protein CusA/SilA